MKHERRMMQRVLCGLVLFGCLGLLWTAGAGVDVSTPAYGATASATAKEDLGTAQEQENRGEYSATGAGDDLMTTSGGTAEEIKRVTVEADQPVGVGRVVWDREKTNLTKFTGRAAGWGANYTVEGEKKPDPGPGQGAAEPKPWYSYFTPDRARVVLEINGRGDDDNTVLLGTENSSLTINVSGAASGEEYKVKLDCSGTGDVQFAEEGSGGFSETMEVTLIGNTAIRVDLKGTRAGDISIGGTCLTGNADVVPVSGEVVTLAVEEVTFGAMTEGGIKKVRKDDDSGYYPEPHWKRTQIVASPVCYVSGATMKLKAKFKRELSDGGATAAQSIWVRGTATGQAGDVTFGPVQVSFGVGVGEVEVGEIACDTALVNNKVWHWEKFKITWKMAASNTADAWAGATEIGDTINEVYVTRGTPVVDKLYHSVLYISCKHAKNLTNEYDIRREVYRPYLSRYIVAADGRQLTYYKNYQTASSDLAGLLNTSDGRCGAWVHLLRATWKVQGLTNPTSRMFCSVNTVKGQEDFDNSEKTGADKIRDIKHGLLVKNWSLPDAGEGYPMVSYFRTTGTQYLWSTNSQATDRRGLPGQGNSNPASLFTNHVFTFLLTSATDCKSVDPSYGTYWAQPEQFGERYVEGYFSDEGMVDFPDNPAIKCNKIKVGKDADSLNYAVPGN